MKMKLNFLLKIKNKNIIETNPNIDNNENENENKIFPSEEKEIELEEKFNLCKKMNKIKSLAKKKIEISTEKFWIYNSCKFCKCFFNKDKLYISEKGLNIVKKNIEISEIIKKHFEIDFIKKLLLNGDELELFKFQFKHLNINNMRATKEYLSNLYNGHLKEDDIQYDKEM